MTDSRNRRAHILAAALLLALLFSWPPPAGADDWVRFRGTEGSGVSSDKSVPTEWSQGNNLKWKTRLPGRGFSSPIVVGNRVFVTCYTGADGDLSDLKRHMVCVDRKHGKILWDRSFKSAGKVNRRVAKPGDFAYHGYASHTPVSDGERVYAFFGSDGVYAFDLDGKQLWKGDVGSENRSMFGSSSSPVLYADLLIVTAGNESESIRAFDKKTGEEKWKAEGGSLSGCYGTPAVVKNAEGEDELIISVPEEVWGLNPESGTLKWYAATRVDRNAIPGAVVHDGMIYAFGGMNGGRTALKIGGDGDVTKSNVIWSQSGGPYVPSPVYHDGHLYWFDRRGNVHCTDAKTGEEVSTERVGGNYYASPTLIDGKLYAVSQSDGTVVLRATPELKILAENKLDDDSNFSGCPAVSDGELFLRSDAYLYCISGR